MREDPGIVWLNLLRWLDVRSVEVLDVVCLGVCKEGVWGIR